MTGVRHAVVTTIGKQGAQVELFSSEPTQAVLAHASLPSLHKSKETGPTPILFIADRTALSVYVRGSMALRTELPVDDWEHSVWEAPCRQKADDSSLRFLRLGDPEFRDDFMHDDGALGPWQTESGDWRVHDPVSAWRSVNGFFIHGRGPSGVVSTGNPFWRNYMVSVAVRPIGLSPCGLAFYRQPNGDGYELMWRPQEHGDGAGVLRLDKLRNGVRSPLSSVAQELLPKRWVGFRVAVLEGEIRVFRDHVEVLRTVDDRPFPGGRIALLAGGDGVCLFDDVRVEGNREWSVDSTPDDRWRADRGRQQPQASDTPVGPQHLATFDSRMVVTPSPLGFRGQTRLHARRRTSRDQVVCTLVRRGGICDAEVAVMRGGRSQTVFCDSLEGIPKGGRELLFTVMDDEFRLVQDGSLLIRGSGLQGMVDGLMGITLPRAAAQARFQVSCQAAEPLACVSWDDRFLGAEQQMRHWNSPPGEWQQEPAASGTWWHRCDLYRDFSIDVSPDLVAILSTSGGSLIIGPLASDAHADEMIRVQPDGSGRWTITCPDADTGEARRVAIGHAPEGRLLERCGDSLLVETHGGERTAVPLPGDIERACRIGVESGDPPSLWSEGITLRGQNVLNYDFRRAPVDWDNASGTWCVTHRWQCDPRWCFMSGSSSSGIACMWSKWRFGPDMTLEYCVAPRMDESGTGTYSSACDLNASICATPPDLPSGISVLFGGLGNSGTYVLAQQSVVCNQTDVRLPDAKETHRKWYHVKLRTSESSVSCWVDGKAITDDLPRGRSAGSRVALWTSHPGMMVGRVRISASEAAPCIETVPAGPQSGDVYSVEGRP